MPVGVGDRIYTKENLRTVVAFTGRNLPRQADFRLMCWICEQDEPR